MTQVPFHLDIKGPFCPLRASQQLVEADESFCADDQRDEAAFGRTIRPGHTGEDGGWTPLAVIRKDEDCTAHFAPAASPVGLDPISSLSTPSLRFIASHSLPLRSIQYLRPLPIAPCLAKTPSSTCALPSRPNGSSSRRSLRSRA